MSGVDFFDKDVGVNIKDHNTIYEMESESAKQAKLEYWIAKTLGQKASQVYPNREWEVAVDIFAGTAVLQCLDVSTSHGFVMSLQRPMKELLELVTYAGGEILERANVPRGTVTPESMEHDYERDLQDNIIGVDNE